MNTKQIDIHLTVMTAMISPTIVIAAYLVPGELGPTLGATIIFLFFQPYIFTKITDKSNRAIRRVFFTTNEAALATYCGLIWITFILLRYLICFALYK